MTDVNAVSESARPLLGKRIMITRARPQAAALAHKLQALGAEVVEFPTIEMQPPEDYAALDVAIKNLQSYDWLIFTSVNGVEQFLTRARDLDKTVAESKRMRFAAIGPETAKRLEAAGIPNCLVPKRYQAEGILEMLTPESMRNKKVLIPRAAKARDILPDTLRQWGAEVDVVEAYRTVVPTEGMSEVEMLLSGHKVDVITFTSSSTVANFARLFKGQSVPEVLTGVAVACIGEITKQTVEDLGGRAEIVATESTIDGLVHAIVEYFV
ncbi:MAG: uroporphyrinogen-III synthase [Alphaproteobacteria bacterium]